MATLHPSESSRRNSPDHSSHTANIYDASREEGEWLDDTEDGDDIFEPATDESEDAEFFDPSEDIEADFHGTVLSSYAPSVKRLYSVHQRRPCADHPSSAM